MVRPLTGAIFVHAASVALILVLQKVVVEANRPELSPAAIF